MRPRRISTDIRPIPTTSATEIVKGPALESAHDDLTIVRLTTNNPGGPDDHFGVVYYGTNPKQPNQIAKSPIRLNRYHPETIFRVRVPGLKPQTTHYYWATSIESNGTSDGEKSPVNYFTTPRSGQRIGLGPQPVVQPK
jgi:hypothetical protein